MRENYFEILKELENNKGEEYYIKRSEISEKISKFQGVIIYFLYYYN